MDSYPKIAGIISIILGVAAFLDPIPALIAAVLVFPWLNLLGAFFFESWNRSTTYLPFALSAVTLVIIDGQENLRDEHLVSWLPVIIVGIAVGFTLALFSFLIPADARWEERRQNARHKYMFWLAPFVVMVMYVAGFCTQTNSLLDHAPKIASYETTVSSKEILHSRRRGLVHYVNIAPVPHVYSGGSVTVSAATYADAAVGQKLCMTLHPGKLRMPWYDLKKCAL